MWKDGWSDAEESLLSGIPSLCPGFRIRAWQSENQAHHCQCPILGETSWQISGTSLSSIICATIKLYWPLPVWVIQRYKYKFISIIDSDMFNNRPISCWNRWTRQRTNGPTWWLFIWSFRILVPILLLIHMLLKMRRQQASWRMWSHGSSIRKGQQ